MSLERKQHADLVRHRELNALRRLMVQRGKAEALIDDPVASLQTSAFDSSNAIGKIDALEAQMNQQLFAQGTGGVDTDAGGFSLTRIQAFDEAAQTTQSMPTQQMQVPNMVQQAAEQFANGKTQAAQNVLEQTIAKRDSQESRVPTWLVLFDLYRATDQVDRFEALALDFSIRFGRSPPPWISLPEQARLAEREHEGAAIGEVGNTGWVAPAVLRQDDLFALESAVQAAIKAPHHLTVNWQAFMGGDANQWRLLKLSLDYLASQPVQCDVLGLAVIEQLFQSEVPESVLARLALMRCQNRAQAFEDLAIDYSVQFEISPPDWIRPACRFEVAQNVAPSVVLAPELTSLAPELYGILDDASAAKQLALLKVVDGMVIRCDRLVRCDLLATLAISRFLQAAKVKGQAIELQGVHRLQAAYFALQNLSEVAKVTIRRD